MNFAERLKKLRKERGLSQNKLAKAIGVHFTQVSRYERGDTKPNAEAMTKLAHALDTTVDYLMNGASDDIVNNAGLEKEKIHYELFFSGNSEDKKHITEVLENKVEGTDVTIVDGGKEFHFKVKLTI